MAKAKAVKLDKEQAKQLDKIAKEHAKHMQELQATLNQYNQIQKQIEAEKKKSQGQMHKVMQDTQTKVLEMQKETYSNRAKSVDKLHQKVTQLMKS